MDTQPELKNSKEIIVYLSNRFPNCFSVEGEAKPLKVGIFQDLTERLANEEQFSKTKLRAVLRSYTASWRYLYCIKEGAHRVDLDGNIGEVITAEQAEHAQAQLKESKEKAKANRKVIENNKEKPVRRPSSKPKMKQNTTRQNSLSKSPEKVTNTVSKPVQQKVDIAQLKVNDAVKIVLGSKPVPATISSIEKGNIKVKISSGMELTVTVERILL
ncbi:RNA chaperone ProQ [Orbus mooreae]|uniref:RNA chaperone ProQ n=1 Tax=Orbus mooreae TaxID=3074107 RepID=UPI00370D4EB2